MNLKVMEGSQDPNGDQILPQVQDIKSLIFQHRAQHCVPDLRRVADWCFSMFQWLFGDGKSLSEVAFLKEEKRLRSELEALLCARVTEVHDDQPNELATEPRAAKKMVEELFEALEGLYPKMMDDLEAIYHTDPAATTKVEVMTGYPGFFAIVMHRIAHALWEQGGRLMARLITEYVHSRTGIDMHLGAKIGERYLSVEGLY